jgi:hypothetical protein
MAALGGHTGVGRQRSQKQRDSDQHGQNPVALAHV